MNSKFGAAKWLVLLALAVVAVPAAAPLFSSGKYFFSDDGFLHLFRVFALDRELHQGVVYPRWLPEFGFGYGFPVFNFYAPLVYYLAESFHLVGLPIADAIKAEAAATIALATVGAYLLGAQFFRASHSARWAGVLTAAAYVYFPYFLVDIYTRGAFAEALAAAILPWFLWSFLCLLERLTTASVVLCALAFAALMYSHNMVVYLSMPLVGALLLWQLPHLPSGQRSTSILGTVGALLLGLALSAVFWLPSLSELQFVWLSRDIQKGAALYLTDLLSLNNVVQLSVPYEYVVHPFPLSLAPLALGLVGLTAACVLCRDRLTRGRLLILGIVTFVCATLMLDFTLPVWLRVPLLNGIQFPWRLSTFVGLGVALMIGAMVGIVLPQIFGSTRATVYLRPAIVILFAGVLMWNGMDRLFVQKTFGPSGEPTLGQIARNEMNMGRLGLSSQREYLPVTVNSVFESTSAAPSVGESPVIALEKYSSVERAFTISSRDAISISLRSFYFPGWQAFIDGAPVATFPATPMGLVSTLVQNGQHRVDFKWQDTLPRQIGAYVTFAGILILLVLIIRRREEGILGIVSFFGIGVLIFALPAFVALTSRPAPLQPSRQDVSPELRLIGWRADESRDRLELNIIWQVKQPVKDKPVLWRFVDQTGRAWQAPEQMARYGSGLPSTWLPNEIIEDHYTLPIDPAMPSGKLKLDVAFGGDYSSVGVVELNRTSSSSAPEPAIMHRLSAQVGDVIEFLGYNTVDSARPGESIPLTLFWQAKRSLSEDYTVFAQVLDSDGERVAQWDSLTDGVFPTMLWTPQVTVADRREILLPRNLEPGLYRVVAGMYRRPDDPERLSVVTADGPSANDVIELGELKIPMRSSNASPQHELNASVGSTIRLDGYDLQVTQDKISLSLHWQAIASVGVDYKVFVHLIDDAGDIVAQQDQMPRQGKYPTRIWETGERIVDPYSISLAGVRTGRYRLLAGMYSPDSGERLMMRDKSGKELANREMNVGSLEVGVR